LGIGDELSKSKVGGISLWEHKRRSSEDGELACFLEIRSEFGSPLGFVFQISLESGEVEPSSPSRFLEHGAYEFLSLSMPYAEELQSKTQLSFWALSCSSVRGEEGSKTSRSFEGLLPELPRRIVSRARGIVRMVSLLEAEMLESELVGKQGGGELKASPGKRAEVVEEDGDHEASIL
jgi:hypothetical protein